MVATGAWLLLTGALTLIAITAHGADAPKARPERLGDTQWQLVAFHSMNDATGTVRPDRGAHYAMRLNADGSVTMRLYCNRARGAWTADTGPDGTSGRFVFGAMISTRALCPPPSMDERIAADTEYVRGFRIENGHLYLSLMADAGIYEWEPQPPPPGGSDAPRGPEAGGPRNWVVTDLTGMLRLRAAPSTRAPVIGGYTPGTLLDNLGCLRAEGRTWCDVQRLGGGARGFVAADYLEPAVSPDGRVATGPDDSALRAGHGRFDATGRLPCAQERGQPIGQCQFGVARAGGGYATVVVTLPAGRERVLYFRMGQAIGADTSEAEGERLFSVTREDDLQHIRVGPERYEVPDAVVLGG
jgi:heat shock protein HslJ